ncbi:phosphotransferase [Pseudoalteromonas viridis]|uniref:Phosphotransferase n=1 Tax=Pseudoalteromonas viridis TaxID=339617 RepID=A0ABX7V847_9GAMM|nr:phosphotransferase [Pseudoalteromonas viridis]QTL35847.1 phosphotransferase [Pseudoalteromonas viridis]
MPLCDAPLRELIKHAFPYLTISTLCPLNKGLSNKNYYLEQAQQGYLLKHYSSVLPTLALEAQSQLAKLGVAQPVVDFDTKTRLALFEFVIEGDEVISLDDQLLAQLHTLHGFELPQIGQLDLSGALLEAGRVLDCSPQLALLAQQLAQFEADICFCHNDLVKDNILATPQGPVFIDFEYAQYNDRYFDLAALCVSFSLSVGEAVHMLKRYYRQAKLPCPDYALDKLSCYVRAYLWLCIAWYQQRHLQEYVGPLQAQLAVWQS